MANQSLKEQIEAAKSALARREVSAIPVVEPVAPPLPTAPPQDTDRVPAIPQRLATESAAQAVTENVSANSDDVNSLANRVATLEDQLASNQRDLQTLIRKIREITRVQQHGTGTTETKTSRSVRRKWRKIIPAVIAIAAGSAIAVAYVLTPDQVAMVGADIYALFSGVVQQLSHLVGLE